jgi:hypothetical protein
MTFGETGQPGFSVVTLGQGGVEGIEHVRVSCQPRRELEVRTTELSSDGDVCAAVLRRLEVGCAEDALVKLLLNGPISRDGYHQLDLSRVWQFGMERSFAFDLDTEGLFLEVSNDAAGTWSTVSLSQPEEIRRCTAELLAAAADNPAEQALLQEASQRLLDCYVEEGAA